MSRVLIYTVISAALLAALWSCSESIAPCNPEPEVCDGVDNDCNGLTDDIPDDACGIDVGECRSGHQACAAGEKVCQDAIEPADEVCNNKDDDCDDQTDEELAACACTGGAPGAEICNGIDDDCNEAIDDLPNCACTGGQAPGSEVCNGIDDDCNNAIDEGFQVGQACSEAGACGDGVWECAPDGARRCSTGPEGSQDRSSAEVCNGIDDDCDGQTDQGLVACACTGGQPPGTEVCNGIDDDCNQAIDDLPNCACTAGAGPGTEVCNGIDDDCDGTIDQGFEVGLACAAPGACGAGVWECAPGGARRCSSGPGGSQDGSSAEVCNGLDDDCDDQTDESNGAGGGCAGFGDPCQIARDCTTQMCVGDLYEHYCTSACDLALPDCPAGYRCYLGPNGDFCRRDYPPCQGNIDCPAGQVCTVQDADDFLSKVTECRPALAGGVTPGQDCQAALCANDLCTWGGFCTEVCSTSRPCSEQYLGKSTACVLGGYTVTPGQCGRDAQCPGGFTCQAARCTGSTVCSSDAECPTHYACKPPSGDPSGELRCRPAAFNQYIGNCQIPCAGDSDCTMSCSPAPDCPDRCQVGVSADGTAIQGICNPLYSGSPTGSPCDDGCDHGICYTSSNYCSQLCGDATQCPTGMNCTPGTLWVGSLGSFPAMTCTF